MSDPICGYCSYERTSGMDYCGKCGRPLSADALNLEYNQKKDFEERFKEVL